MRYLAAVLLLYALGCGGVDSYDFKKPVQRIKADSRLAETNIPWDFTVEVFGEYPCEYAILEVEVEGEEVYKSIVETKYHYFPYTLNFSKEFYYLMTERGRNMDDTGLPPIDDPGEDIFGGPYDPQRRFYRWNGDVRIDAFLRAPNDSEAWTINAHGLRSYLCSLDGRVYSQSTFVAKLNCRECTV